MSSAGTYWVLATQNAKKAKELVTLTGGLIPVKTLKDLGLDNIEIIEDGDTFEANAKIKAQTIWAHLKEKSHHPMPQWVIADDSGLCVEALKGGPGIRSARYALDAGFGEGDADNNALLFQSLADFKTLPERRAYFACAVCAVDHNDQECVFYNEVHGCIAHGLSGEGGFGYDPLFIPDAYTNKTMAELTADEKHAISHRGKAMAALCEELLG